MNGVKIEPLNTISRKITMNKKMAILICILALYLKKNYLNLIKHYCNSIHFKTLIFCEY